ncbi:hypothetical protein CEXT_428811, partial [Caerostris extrusa]
IKENIIRKFKMDLFVTIIMCLPVLCLSLNPRRMIKVDKEHLKYDFSTFLVLGRPFSLTLRWISDTLQLTTTTTTKSSMD